MHNVVLHFVLRIRNGSIAVKVVIDYWNSQAITGIHKELLKVCILTPPLSPCSQCPGHSAQSAHHSQRHQTSEPASLVSLSFSFLLLLFILISVREWECQMWSNHHWSHYQTRYYTHYTVPMGNSSLRSCRRHVYFIVLVDIHWHCMRLFWLRVSS